MPKFQPGDTVALRVAVAKRHPDDKARCVDLTAGAEFRVVRVGRPTEWWGHVPTYDCADAGGTVWPLLVECHLAGVRPADGSPPFADRTEPARPGQLFGTDGE